MGNLAPDLYITSRTSSNLPIADVLPSNQFSLQKTVLVFYESGCGSCESLLHEVENEYGKLKEKGWRIISLAADKEAGVFNKLSGNFPWQDKYCDFKGFEGVNFKNYGIIGTPTLFLIDENGIILNRTAQLSDILSDN